MLLRRIARPMLAAAFVGQGIDALRSPKPAADAARPALEGLQKLPEPVGSNVPRNAETFAKVTAAVQIAGGLLLASGKVPRLASAALATTVVPANLGAHMFWTEVDPERKAAKRRDFLTDISLLGGLIIASADTAGQAVAGLAWPPCGGPTVRQRRRGTAVRRRLRSGGPRRAPTAGRPAGRRRTWARTGCRGRRTRRTAAGGRPRTQRRRGGEDRREEPRHCWRPRVNAAPTSPRPPSSRATNWQPKRVSGPGPGVDIRSRRTRRRVHNGSARYIGRASSTVTRSNR